MAKTGKKLLRFWLFLGMVAAGLCAIGLLAATIWATNVVGDAHGAGWGAVVPFSVLLVVVAAIVAITVEDL